MQSGNDSWLGQDDFSITISRDSEGSVNLVLAGEFDLSAAADLRSCLMQAEVLDARRVHVDCAGVTFGTFGIGLLVNECKRARRTRAAMSEHNGDGEPRVLQVSGLIGLNLEGARFSATQAGAPQSRARGS